MLPIEIRQKYSKTYSEIAKNFVLLISDANYDGIPEPFFPVFGSNYFSSKKKIMFVGIETKGYGNITEFVKDSKNATDDFLFRGQFDFDNLEFLNWGSNFGNDFWGFVFHFLAEFYGVESWKILKKGEKPEILRSFAWGNSNSIERYEVSAKEKKVQFEDWKRVKTSSEILDRAKFLLDIFSPDTMIILNWGLCDSYFKGLRFSSEIEIEDHLLSCTFENYPTRLFWTSHPNWLNKNKDFDKFILKLVKLVKE